MRFLLDMVPELTAGFAVTPKLIVCSVPLGLLLGVIVAISRTYGPRPIRLIAALYQSVFRGVPSLVQLFILYYTHRKSGFSSHRLLQRCSASASAVARTIRSTSEARFSRFPHPRWKPPDRWE